MPLVPSEAMGLSKNFSFWTVSLDLDAMFKTKSLPYKDLVLNSRGCRKSNQLLRHPQCGSKIFLLKNGMDLTEAMLPVLTASVSPRMVIVLCRSDVFCVSKKTRVHILTRMSKYEQGGSWKFVAKNCVVGKRNNNNPDNSNDNLGFRVAMSKN